MPTILQNARGALRVKTLPMLACVPFLFVAISPTSTRADDASPATRPAVLFFDDFSGPSLDRTKWNVEVTRDKQANNEQQAYVDSPDTLYISHGPEADGAQSGALVIRAVSHPGFTTPAGTKLDFLSARINTRNKIDIACGSFAARMKLPPYPGLWPAFWLLGPGRWPDTGEIDVMECVGDPSWISSALHGPKYFGNTPLTKRTTLPRTSDVSAWHIYSVDWTPDSLTFKIDGAASYLVTRPMVEHYGPWAFDNKKFLILNLALGGVYPKAINHVDSPYHGLPAETVQAIKDDKAKLIVDWVRVTASTQPSTAR